MIGRLFGGASPPHRHVLAVDRIACTGRGICAELLSRVELDEWGYPIVHEGAPDQNEAYAAVVMCPARALRWVKQVDG